MASRQERDQQLGQYEIPAFAAATVVARQDKIVWHLSQMIELVRQNEADIARWMRTAQERVEYPAHLRRQR